MTDDELRQKIREEMLNLTQEDPHLRELTPGWWDRIVDVAMRYRKEARASESAFDEAAAQKETP